MKKKLIRNTVLETIAGQTKPGQKIASFGVNMSKFCLDVNKLTQGKGGKSGIVRVKLKIDDKKNWEIKLLESAPTIVLFKGLLEEAGEKSFLNLSQEKQKEIIEKLTKSKMVDLNTEDSEKAQKIIIGSLQSFGIRI